VNFTLRHPRHPSRLAVFGVDPARGGLYLDVACDGGTLSWDAAELGGDHADPILGALAVLGMFGFLSGRDVEDVVAWLGVSHGEKFWGAPPSGWPVRCRPRRGVRRVLRLIRELREVEGGG
jgi:hypothetical protein